ncbi:MAG: AAA family ATPase, partial [Crocinitomicaceae bacterium]|nr:AAA family ATPase [Crocinitomicaceae bacterium]
MDLFDTDVQAGPATRPPLAARMRPKTLDDYVGQEQIIGPGKLLRRAIESDQLSSVIFYGPPGTGKTTLARIVAETTKATFHSMNAVLSGVKDIREAIVLAKEAKQKRNQ